MTAAPCIAEDAVLVPARPRYALKPVVVVEDDPDDRVLIAAELSEFGYEAVFADEESDAIAALETRAPVAVVLDYRLPSANGVEILRRIRSASQFRRVPTVIFTGLDPLYFMIDAYLLGAKAVVEKSYAPARLGPTLRQVCRGEKPSSFFPS